MAINLATKYSSNVDEVFRRESLTNEIANNGRYDFVGTKTVKVYSMGTAPMNDYQASGSNRYGTPVELEDTTEELTLTQQRAFTFTIDATNAADSPAGVRDAATALRRQLDTVIIPEIDLYRLQKAALKAGTINFGEITGEDESAYYAFASANAELTDKEVPIEGRVAYCTSDFIKHIKNDINFIKASEIAQGMLIKGQVGEIDGVKIISTPSTRLPYGASFIIMWNGAMTSPIKLAEYKIHENPPGIAGHLIEGLVYYDAFITKNKQAGAAVHFGKLGKIPLTMTASGTGRGVLNYPKRNITGKLVYKTASSVSALTLSATPTGWTDVPDNGIITATSGHKIAVAEVVNNAVTAVSDVITVVVGS